MANKSIWINKSEFGMYREISVNTATKEYALYLEKAGKEPDQTLTIYDLSTIDKLPINLVKQRLNRE